LNGDGGDKANAAIRAAIKKIQRRLNYLNCLASDASGDVAEADLEDFDREILEDIREVQHKGLVAKAPVGVK